MRLILAFTICFLANSTYGQVWSKMAIKVGPTFNDQTKTPTLFADGGMTNGFAISIDPTWYTFGSNTQFDVNSDLSYIRKGGQNLSYVYTYDQAGNLLGTGSETYKVTMDYFSYSPSLKWKFAELLYLKAGPRLDVLLGFKTDDMLASDPRTRSDFNTVTFGATYGLGICLGKKSTKFLLELVGQNDFTNSSHNPSTNQTFKNNCYIMNFGVLLDL